MSAQAFGAGAAQTAGANLTQALLNTQQGQQAVQFTANTIAQGGAALVGGAVAAGTAVTGAGTAVVAAGTAFAVAAAPVVITVAVITGIGFGLGALVAWMDT